MELTAGYRCHNRNFIGIRGSDVAATEDIRYIVDNNPYIVIHILIVSYSSARIIRDAISIFKYSFAFS